MPNLAAVPTGSAVDPCCCGPVDCCTYPAYSLSEGLLTFADLPDTIYVYISGYEIGDPPIFDGELTKSIYFGDPIYRDDDDIISIRPSGDFLWAMDVSSATFYETSRFLICDDYDIGRVEDLFNATYSVSTGGTINRNSGCNWSGGGNSLVLLLDGWYLNGVRKINPQNSPVGNYGGISVT